MPLCGTCAWLGFLLCVVALGGGARPLSAQGSDSDTVATTLQQVISGARDPALRWPTVRSYQADLRALYQAPGAASLLWTVRGRPTAQARSVIRALADADQRGVDPQDYDAPLLTRRAAALDSAGSSDARALALFDVALSADLMRLASDLHAGRVDPQAMRFDLPDGPAPLDLAGLVRAVQRGAHVDSALDGAEPQFLRYVLLKRALASYRARTDDPQQAQHVRQILLTMERWRWLPPAQRARFVVVNIPAFMLYAFDRDASKEGPVLSMPVVVGGAFRHKTPVFAGELQYLIFRPYWDVPTSIARQELVPKLRRDPALARRERYEIVAVDAPMQPTRTYPVTGETLDRVAAGTLHLRQRPGDGNSLGFVKFVFPNEYDVYLHDTPARELFTRTRRDFSHGCIRVERPVQLAQFVLQGVPEWTAAAIDTAMHYGPDARRVDVPSPLRVYILYGTAVADSSGEVHFYQDIYGYDATLERALARRGS